MTTTEVRRSSEVETSLRRPTMPAEVLAAARAERQAADRAEANLLQLAVEWAVMHPVESVSEPQATLPGTEGDLAVAGEGAPLVAEFCVAEFAAAIGLSPDAGALYVGEAVPAPACLRTGGRGDSGGVEGQEDRRPDPDPVVGGGGVR